MKAVVNPILFVVCAKDESALISKMNVKNAFRLAGVNPNQAHNLGYIVGE